MRHDASVRSAQGSHGGSLPGVIGGRLEYDVRVALGALSGVVVHRNQVAMATLETGARVLTGLGGKGAPDLMVEVRTHSGVTACLWLECKAGTGELNPDQRRWHAAATLMGRHAAVARSVDEALAAVERAKGGASE